VSRSSAPGPRPVPAWPVRACGRFPHRLVRASLARVRVPLPPCTTVPRAWIGCCWHRPGPESRDSAVQAIIWAHLGPSQRTTPWQSSGRQLSALGLDHQRPSPLDLAQQGQRRFEIGSPRRGQGRQHMLESSARGSCRRRPVDPSPLGSRSARRRRRPQRGAPGLHLRPHLRRTQADRHRLGMASTPTQRVPARGRSSG